MLEGLFIFCLLIRAVSRGGDAEAGEGAGSDTPGRMKGLTKGNTLFQRKYQLLPPTAPLAGMLCERLKKSEVEDR